MLPVSPQANNRLSLNPDDETYVITRKKSYSGMVSVLADPEELHKSQPNVTHLSVKTELLNSQIMEFAATS